MCNKVLTSGLWFSNIRDQGFYETIQATACTSSLHGNHYTCMYSLTALNVILAITASLGNALTLVALRKDSLLHPPSKLMFRCLTVTDLCVGLLSQPFYVIQLVSIIHEQLKLCYTMVSINEITSAVFCGVSLFTLTTISVDRLVAFLFYQAFFRLVTLHLGLRYTQVWQVITLRRTQAILIVMWILNISIFCLRRFWKYVLISRVISVLAIAAFFYLKIYVTLRRHRIELHWRGCSAMQTKQRRNESSEHKTIQKNCVNGIVCSVSVSSLLPSLRYTCCYDECLRLIAFAESYC